MDRESEATRHSWLGKRGGSRHRFMFYNDLMDRLQLLRMLPAGALLMRCGDVECVGAVDPVFYNIFDFLPPFSTYGRLHPLSGDLRRAMAFPPDPDGGERLTRQFLALNAALRYTDEQIALGPEEEMEEVLSSVLDGTFDTCIFEHSCVNRVMGSALEDMASRVSRDRGVRIIGNPNTGIRGYLEEVASACGGGPGDGPEPGRGRGVSLVGFVEERSTTELAGALRLLGVRVDRTVVPDLSRFSMDEMRRAGLQVLFPLRAYETIYDAIFRKLGTPTIMPAAPYGVASTRRWCEAIARKQGIDPAGRTGWMDYLRRKEDDWARLSLEAARHAIGFVVTAGDAEALADPAGHLFGIPLVPVLEEMGFKIEFLVVGAGDRETCRQVLNSMLERAGVHKITFAGGDDDVGKWLEWTGARCIYSDLKNDRRITSRGKSTFSLLLLEAGFEGFVRSMKKLLRLVTTGYYSDYRDYRQKEASPVGL